MITAYSIQDRVCLVTGANRGIGKAITETFLKHGAKKVYAGVRKIENALLLQKEYGERITPLVIDITDDKTISAAIEISRDVEVVVNNAGVLKTTRLLDSDAVDALKYEMDVNVYGLLRMIKVYAPILAANGGGAFVQLNSVASLKSFPEIATYCASKAAAYSITQACRAELSAQGTRVVSVHPGPIQSDMADSAGMTEIAEPPEVVAEAIIRALKSGSFHSFPDTLAQEMGTAYASFATSVIESNES